MQKALTQMQVELDTVWNDVMGKSGEAIVRSVVGGERDATQLARLIYAMLTRGEESVEKGLSGFETERRERPLRHLRRQAKHFNLALVPTEQAA